MKEKTQKINKMDQKVSKNWQVVQKIGQKSIKKNV